MSIEFDRLTGKRAPLWLGVLGVALFLPLLGSFGLWDPYEVRIADLAKEVASSPTWSLPARALRPPLPVWAIAAGYRFLGGGELAGRLPIALLSIAALFACFYAGTALVRRRGAFFGALVLLTTPAFFLGARQLATAVVPVLATTLAVGGLARAAWPNEDQGGRIGHLLLGLVGLVAGFYGGGLGLGVAVPLGAVAIGLLVARGPSNERWIASIATLAAIAGALWGWRSVLVHGHAIGYSPLLGGTPRPSQHAIEYVTVLKQIGFGAFPWIALLPLAAGRAFADLGREGDGERRADYGRFVILGWVLASYLGTTLFEASVADTAFAGYAALALAAGFLLDELWDEPEKAPIAGLAVLLGGALLAHDLFMQPELAGGPHVLEGIKWPAPLAREPYFFLVAGLAWAALAGLSLALRPSVKAEVRPPSLSTMMSRQTLLGGSLCVALAYAAGATFWIVPAVSRHLSYKGLFVKFKALSGTSSSEIGRYHVPGQLSEYGQTTELPSLSQAFDFLARPQRVFVIAAADDLPAIDQFSKSRGETPYYVVDDSNSRFLMLSNRLGANETDLNPLKRFILKALPHPPSHELHADFEGKVELVGYDVPAEVDRGHAFTIRMYYKVDAPLGNAYKVFTHFDGAGTRFNGDHVPLEGRFPTNYWVPGFYVIDEHVVDPERATQPAGVYQIYTGFWLGDQRLKVVAGPQDGENRVKLGTLKVK